MPTNKRYRATVTFDYNTAMDGGEIEDYLKNQGGVGDVFMLSNTLRVKIVDAKVAPLFTPAEVAAKEIHNLIIDEYFPPSKIAIQKAIEKAYATE